MPSSSLLLQQIKRRRSALFLGSAMVVCFALGSAVINERAVATNLAAQTDVDRYERGYADLVETLLPAVVNVQIKRSASAPAIGDDAQSPEVPEFFKRFFDQAPDGGPVPNNPVVGEGSGFIIDPEGYIVTNAHVVAGATSIAVVATDGGEFEATLIGVDSKTDLALLKIEADDPLPFVEFGDSETVRVGDKVLSVGNPFGLGGTVTSGIVSATGRQIGAGPYDDFMQIDAAINRGNSGGPTFNLDGEVIGVNSVIFSPSGGSVGIGFAISADLAEQIIEDLRDDGNVQRGWLGVNIQTLDDELAAAFGLDSMTGALVSKIERESPADKAGLQSGDVILAYNGEAIEVLTDLSKMVAATKPGNNAIISIWRDGETQEIDLQIELMPARQEVAALVEEPIDEPELGLTLAELTPAERAEAGLAENDGGVRVANVETGSPAATKGIGAGSIILSVNDTEVSSPADAKAQIRSAHEKGEKTLLLLVQQTGGTRFVALPLAVS
ncbi:MAG: Do family serine endopeptidase [Pseudomonadota bacterium]